MINNLNGVIETVDYKDLDGIRLYMNDCTDSYPIHWHSAVELIMPYENTYTVTINAKSYLLREGDIIIIPPGILHLLTTPQTPGRRLILQFDYSILCAIRDMDFLIPLLQPCTIISKSNEELNPRLTSILNEIVEEYEAMEPLANASIYSLMIRFFTLMGRHLLNAQGFFPDVTAGKQNEYMEKIMMVCNHITEHCTEDLDVESIAKLAGFSKFHFSRVFKQLTGLSCYKYLLQKRLTYAEQLLIGPDISMTDAAMRSGFKSISSFNRIFRLEKGCSPSEYKSMNYSLLKAEAEKKP